MGNKLARLIATWFGCGYSPVAPGTLGSMAALGLAMILHQYWGWRALEFAALAAVWILPGIWAARSMARQSGQNDPGVVVVDEVIGQWITLAGVTSYGWKSWLAALVLFRLFDIWKPAPVRQAEALAGGLGIVADDVVAGAYGALVLFAAGCFNLY